jgi:uncharacterized protein
MENFMSQLPLMPRATAVWLVENTALSFEQIAAFCGMHPLEIQGIADGEVANNVIGIDPVAKGLLNPELLKQAENDHSIQLKLKGDYEDYLTAQKRVKKRYTPVARRQDKPDAIAWLLKQFPDISDAQIGKLIGTTKNTIAAIRHRDHWNMANIRPRDPVLLGLCTQTDLQALADKFAKHADALRAQERGAQEHSEVDTSDAA